MSDDLIAFCRARLDEVAAAARAVGADRIETASGMWETKYLVLHQPDGGTKATAELDADLADHIARHNPTRVLADVEAKRQIIDEYEQVAWVMIPWAVERANALRVVLKSLAAVDADHPEFRDIWRP